jgi:hypothetical protein
MIFFGTHPPILPNFFEKLREDVPYFKFNGCLNSFEAVWEQGSERSYGWCSFSMGTSILISLAVSYFTETKVALSARCKLRSVAVSSGSIKIWICVWGKKKSFRIVQPIFTAPSIRYSTNAKQYTETQRIGGGRKSTAINIVWAGKPGCWEAERGTCSA